MDAISLMTRFQLFEGEQGLFAQKVDGAPWWDSVRYDVHSFLGFVLLGRGLGTAPPLAPYWRRMVAAALASVMREKLYQNLGRNQQQILLIRAARNFENNAFRDIIVDPVGALFDEKTYSIDTFPRRHHVPAFQVSRRSGSVPKNLRETVATLLEAFYISQDRAGELEKIIRFRRFVFEAELRSYDRLFKRARPKMIVLVQNGIEKALFRVARAHGVPTAELQHGLVGYTHPAYSYPKEIDYSDQETFPDLFLSFSEFWDRACYYPATVRIPTGNDSYFVRPMSAAPDCTAMVVSAGMYHATLAPWVRAISKLSPERRLIYKLHPGQKPFAAKIEAEFADLPNVEVFSGQIPASALLKQVSCVIGVCSTVMYEALQAGRTVFIIPEQDYRSHSDILDLPGVVVPSTPEELDRALGTVKAATAPPRFFEPFDPALAKTALELAIKQADRELRKAS
jgi:hypothetical protein